MVKKTGDCSIRKKSVHGVMNYCVSCIYIHRVMFWYSLTKSKEFTKDQAFKCTIDLWSIVIVLSSECRINVYNQSHSCHDRQKSREGFSFLFTDGSANF